MAGSNNAIFLSGSLTRHVTVMSFTSSVGLMAIFAVDFVDMIFIAMLGNDALAAAVGYAGTVLFFTNAFNIGLSIAAGSLVAKAIGANKPQDARECATSVAMIGLVSGILVPVLIWFNLSWFLELLGAETPVKELAERYIRIILPTMPVMALAMTSMAVLRAHGDARRSMFATLYGGIVNAVLDPLLIFGLGMGLDGAAIASVIARLVMLAVGISAVIRVYKGLALPGLGMLARDFKVVVAIAIPAVLTNIATPVGMAIVTREIARFGSDAVAGMAVIGRLTPVAFAVILALSGAIGPIIGQNYGASQFDRVRGAFVAGIKFTALYVVVASLILYLFRAPIADLFDASGMTRTLIYLFCGPLALASFFNGVIFVGNASFNNLGHPVYSTWTNWGRHTLGTWPFAIAGASLAGAPGVLIGQALGGLIFAGISWYLVERVIRNLDKPCTSEPFLRHRRFHTIFGTGRW